MIPAESESEPPIGVTAEGGATAPRASDWLWRPWYAKLWWISIAIFWTGALVVPWVDVPGIPAEGGYLDYVAMILHPQVALPVLGFGFVRKWLDFQLSRPNESDVPEDLLDGDGRMGSHRPRSYLTDPFDPRSIANSINPVSRQWRDRHVRRKF